MKNYLDDILTACCGFFVFFTIIFFPSFVFAEDIPNIDGLLESISSRNYPLLVAFGLTILVWFVRRVTPKKLFPKKYVPYAILIISVLSGAATGIIMFVQDGQIWWYGLIKGILEGFSAGLMSMGVWSSGGKKLLKIEKNEDDE